MTLKVTGIKNPGCLKFYGLFINLVLSLWASVLKNVKWFCIPSDNKDIKNNHSYAKWKSSNITWSLIDQCFASQTCSWYSEVQGEWVATPLWFCSPHHMQTVHKLLSTHVVLCVHLMVLVSTPCKFTLKMRLHNHWPLLTCDLKYWPCYIVSRLGCFQ